MVTHIQRYSIHDGPGIRTTVFLKGCDLRCEWCHNPECINQHSEITFRLAKCGFCGKCARICPIGAVSLEREERINREKCSLCMKCVDACPYKALSRVGKAYSVDEVFEEVKRDFLFFLNSHGGITISGGEPLLQSKFTKALFQLCKRLGISTALETTGYAQYVTLGEIADLTDLILYDVKHMDSNVHRRFTGVSNDLIISNLKRLAGTNREKVRVRVPIIPNFNYSKECIHAIADFVSSLDITRLDLLPYHRYGEAKYRTLGRHYLLKEVKDLAIEQVRPLEKIAQSHGLKTTVGG